MENWRSGCSMKEFAGIQRVQMELLWWNADGEGGLVSKLYPVIYTYYCTIIKPGSQIIQGARYILHQLLELALRQNEQILTHTRLQLVRVTATCCLAAISCLMGL